MNVFLLTILQFLTFLQKSLRRGFLFECEQDNNHGVPVYNANVNLYSKTFQLKLHNSINKHANFSYILYNNYMII